MIAIDKRKEEKVLRDFEMSCDFLIL
jgi:hypothetical protein